MFAFTYGGSKLWDCCLLCQRLACQPVRSTTGVNILVHCCWPTWL